MGNIDLTEFNKAVKQLAKDNGACATDPKGNTHYMGVYEQERSYAEFMTWGAKNTQLPIKRRADHYYHSRSQQAEGRFRAGPVGRF